MPVSTTLHQDGSQERPPSLMSTTSSSGSSRDSHSAMEEPTGSEASAQNGTGSPWSRHVPNSNNSSGWLNMKGPLSPFNGRAGTGPAYHKLNYLGRVVREIVETERMYVQDLRSIVEDYLSKIIDTPGLLKPEQVSALFGNIESIYALNSQLLRDLDSCNNDPVAVASCFVERSQEFDIYTQYCNNYPNSVAALTECMQDKQQAKFFRDRQELLQHSLPLGSYLLKPVQRILKYHLLLQEIAKHFDEEEDGFEVVVDAIDTMTCVAWYINDMKRRHEHAVRLQEIQSLLINWKGPDLTTFGELVLEATFRVHRVRNERTFFLFDKILLITKKRGDHFVYKGHIPCSSLMLIESTKDSLCFTLTHYKHSKQQYSIQAKTAEEKRSWTHHIKRLILENHHATIPQKAKEAILEMDSYYPSRYRCSPERLKKAWSSQDEVSTHVRQGRRQSEPGYTLFSRATLPSRQQGLEMPGLKGRRKSEPPRHLLRQLNDKARAAGMKGKRHRESEGSKSCRRPSDRSPTSAEKRMSFESVSSLPEVETDPELGADQEAFTALEVPSTEEMPSDSESPEVLETQLHAPKGLLGVDSPVDVVDFVEPVGPEDLKALSSEEEEEEEGMGTTQESDSLLPPSVLDQASVIAERFASSFSRRSSLAMEDGKSSGLGTPRLISRSSSVLSLEGSEKGLARWGSTGDSLSNPPTPEVVISADMVTDNGPSVNGTESTNSDSGCLAEPGSSCKKKESALSTRDRQLLDKIKNYYENAEHHDAGFSIRRRESLSYIPKGLVRSSVSRFNSLPKPDMEPAAPLGYKRPGSSRPASWALFDLPGPSQSGTGDPAPVTDAEFRPSSEIVKIWERMESSERSPQTGPGQSQANGFELQEPLFILEEHELGAITEEFAVASPESSSPPEQPNPAHLAQELKELVKELSSGAQGELVTPLHPRIVQLSHVMDSHMSERVKNKVYQLARQYSLRIKNIKTARPPLQWDKATPDQDEQIPTISGLPEEEAVELLGGKARRKPVLSLLSYEQLMAQDQGTSKFSSAAETSPRRVSLSPSALSPRTTSPGSQPSTRSPLSPFDTETFNWPDVRELCSKYTSHDKAAQAESNWPRGLLVNRSRSLPENIVEPPVSGKVGLCCSMNTKRPQQGGEASHPPPSHPPPQSSLNGGESLYITADLTLENNHRVIVMEKGPHPISTVGLEEGSGKEPSSPVVLKGRGQGFQECAEYHQPKEEGPRDPADTSKQGRVRNLREKFQALNSVG
ncbi:pleckstrin homology domain-containing family G member 3 isoform X8 [Cricetulus griseus]|uniref:Pleckstrin homology domain-containing family G member 3 isoform X8 n=1 Tax=Cricetulus griseus TaxID=10029 RepID=A0A9J7H0V6_CRIGR|nr:pleckstrin homology domain-containing family G member 3 isoform X8 [Cricetulus griseus]XP_035308551.1 pleckstrin homology domain-containing family G member 3 isoform X8 [Cricetulus griseus]